MYTVQIINNSIFIEPASDTSVYGPKGKVIYSCNKETALNMLKESLMD